MSFISVATQNEIAVLTMQRGKVNAFNLEAVDQMAKHFDRFKEDPQAKALILTGNEKFFSFGFDVPELLTYDRVTLRRFLTGFTRLKLELFIYPKPLIVSLSGHAVAGGCMLALTADYRLLKAGNAKISLNEINLGVPVFAGSVAMLRFCAGDRNAELVLSSGEMYSDQQALKLGLVDQVVEADSLTAQAISAAKEYASKPPTAFAEIKRLLRQEIADRAAVQEPEVIERFMDIWYTPAAQGILKKVEIRS